jgi:SAM-dependent methyltransferase
MKRGLWSKLLTSTLGNQFDDTDILFVEHTLLVNSAEIIAHAVVGITVEDVGPNSLLSGELFEQSAIYGVVEEDFFDWVLEVEGGPAFIRSLARRLSRFDWGSVDQDVLKVLYESVIGAETRKRLGEYYTPDWLAALVVDRIIEAPLSTRVLDPSCGSGTFLFQAVRKYLAAAAEAGVAVPEMLRGVTRSVFGMDLHPVAVTFARVTYLLAIGRQLLMDPSRGAIFIPVYLGDSMQWNDQSTNLWNAGNLVVPVEDRSELFASELRFPDRLLADATMFDDLVEGMADMAARRRPSSRVPSLAPLFQRLAIPQDARETVEATFRVMCGLHDQGRNHIWSYYVRNLARPMWMALVANRVDALVGNPPWLAYRHMTGEMQQTFRAMSEARGLWLGAENATHQDLSTLFVARATQLYLREGGTFGMVMPNAVVDRDHYDGFRQGNYDGAHGEMRIAFEPSWDLRRIRPHFFPRGSSVVFGRRAAAPAPMPLAVERFSGRLTRGRSSREEVEPSFGATG